MKYHIDPTKLVIHDKLVKRVYDNLNNPFDIGDCDFIINYSLNGKRHNPYGPAYIEYVDGVIKYAEWQGSHLNSEHKYFEWAEFDDGEVIWSNLCLI